jgi:hypothetical protein
VGSASPCDGAHGVRSVSGGQLANLGHGPPRSLALFGPIWQHGRMTEGVARSGRRQVAGQVPKWGSRRRRDRGNRPMSDPNAGKVPTLPFMVSIGLIMPLAMCAAAILLDKFVFGARLWILGLVVGSPIGWGTGLGALRLWAGRLPPTVWSESAR